MLLKGKPWEGKSLIAGLGVLGGLAGGLLIAGFAFSSDPPPQEESEIPTRRAEAYLSFLTTRSESDEAQDALAKAIAAAEKAEEPPRLSPTEVQGVCRQLIDPNRAFTAWSQSAKKKVILLCAEWNDARRRLFTLRDTLAIYGSDAVIAQLAEHERARYASPTGQKTRDSYVALIQTMRQDAPDLSGSDAEDRDLLTVICGPVTACFGFEDAGHLEGE